MHFLQSKEWQSFQSDTGSIPRTIHLGKEDIVGYEKIYPFFRYIYIGGVAYSKEKDILLRKALMKKYDAAQIDWLASDGKAGKPAQPAYTMRLDITRSEETLLKNMHHKTRYNIRVAKKHGITIAESKNIDDFISLMEKTASRQAFHSHKKDYYKKMIEMPGAQLLVAKKDAQIVAAIILCTFADTAYYFHGASDEAYKKYMAPYLLQWEAILLAKKHSARKYDFWGVAPPTAHGDSFFGYTWEKGNTWAGFTRFKAGFGGTVVQVFRGEFVVFHKLPYVLYSALSKAKRIFTKKLI